MPSTIKRFKKVIEKIAKHAMIGDTNLKKKTKIKIFTRHIANLLALKADSRNLKRSVKPRAIEYVLEDKDYGLSGFKAWYDAMLKIREVAFKIQKTDEDNKKNEEYTPVLPQLKEIIQEGKLGKIEQICNDVLNRIRDDIKTYKLMTTPKKIHEKAQEASSVKKKHFWKRSPRTFNETAYKRKYDGFIKQATKMLDLVGELRDAARADSLAKTKIFSAAKPIILEMIEKERKGCTPRVVDVAGFKVYQKDKKPHAYAMLTMLETLVTKATNLDKMNSIFSDTGINGLKTRYIDNLKKNQDDSAEKLKGISEKIQAAHDDFATITVFTKARIVLDIEKPPAPTTDMNMQF